ncbi:DP-EP family protein [Shewanella dokdonensis]|uniref:DP-EP family protein n=1 Tax=Shewanella dokdonensis TaxID=712036 RepID=UPI00200CF159|nr:DP-EP family protein [Shewanella dokdonensis]MCL1075259.1 DP-EP family protein [Shewanella dokdonensis]
MEAKKVDTYTFNVCVTVNANKVPTFTYYEPGNPEPLNEKQRAVTVTGPTIIFYKLINTNMAPKGLKFIGAGFKTPYDGIIENAFVSDDGATLILEDLCKDNGTTGFHLLLKSDENTLVMMSPDPEVINKGVE